MEDPLFILFCTIFECQTRNFGHVVFFSGDTDYYLEKMAKSTTSLISRLNQNIPPFFNKNWFEKKSFVML